MQYVKANDLAIGPVLGDSRIGLFFEKRPPAFPIKLVHLRKRHAVLHDIIPYRNSFLRIRHDEFSDFNTHIPIDHFFNHFLLCPSLKARYYTIP